jgi:hypothetical protein
VPEKVPCVECGKPVAVSLANRSKGFCLRCFTKTDPFFVLYNSLIERVYHSVGGFDALSEAEKRYYSVTLFQNEVNNGGFHQFFFNSSGSYYELIENSLVAFNELETLDLVNRAKQVLFPEIPVPADTEARRRLMPAPTPGLMNKLNELDERFYKSPDTLSPKLEAFAREQGLITSRGLAE